jgi:hypothetical protein
MYGSEFTRLCETWFSKNRWLFFASACRCICLVNPDHELCKVASLRRVDTQRLLNIQKTSFDKRLPGDLPGERVAWKFAVERFLCCSTFCCFLPLCRSRLRETWRSAQIVRPKSSRPPFARQGAWNFLVERFWFSLNLRVDLYLLCKHENMCM